MERIATLIVLFALAGCANYPDSRAPELPSADFDAPVAAEPGEPDAGEIAEPTIPDVVAPEFTDAAIAWGRRMVLLTGLPRLDSALTATAVELINAELVAQGYDPGVVEVPVYLGTPGEIAELAGKPAFGWTPGSAIYMIAAEKLCDRPDDYEGRMFGWVLTHELLHTIGFEHGIEMTALTNAVWLRWKDHCMLTQ